MASLTQVLFQSEITEVLAKSLLHTLWQATIIGLIFLLFLKILPTEKNAVRYKLGLVALFAVLLSWLGTLSVLNQKPAANPPSSARATPPPALPATPVFAESRTSFPTSVNSVEEPALAPSIETAESRSKFSVPTILIILWSAGVLLMIVRLFLALTGTQRHRRKSLPIEDPALLKRFDALCRIVGLHRKIIFAATSTLKNPGVIGIVKPMVLIPASMLTGFAASDLEAVVAHELAHIRRHDYLFNLLQMVIESLLFFNPAVWWISHRIRMEREACCDTEAMQATGQQFEYANLLLNQFGGTPATVPAFGNNRKEDAKERLLRIVQPHQKIDLKIGSARLILLLILTTAGIFALAKTSDLAVETVAKILTPKERVEKLIELANRTDDEQRHSVGSYKELEVSGKVKTYDEAPLPKNTRVDACSFNNKGQTSGYSGMRVNSEGRFSVTTHYLDYIIFYTYVDGYAPAFSKPIRMTEAGLSEEPELTLESGFPLTLKVVSAEGDPISGAQINSTYIYHHGKSVFYLYQSSIESGTNGIVQIDHASKYTMRLNIEADGFQPITNQDHAIARGKPLTIIMKRGLPSKGVVVDKKGVPIPVATFRLTHRNLSGQGWDFSHSKKIVTSSDSQGRFNLNRHAPNATYSYIIEAEGYNPIRLTDMTVTNFPQRIELDQERYIRGTVAGDLSKLKEVRDHTTGTTFEKGLRYTGLTFKNDKVHYSRREEGLIEVLVTNGTGYFELKGFVSDEITIYSPDSKQLAIITPKNTSVENVIIDMDSDVVVRNTPHRIVEFTFDSPLGLPLAEGEINVWHTTTEKREQGNTSWTGMKIRVENGEGRASFPAPGYVKLGGSQNLVGYWSEPEDDDKAHQRLIEPGKALLKLNYTLTPAGGISGTIVDEKGQPLNGMNMGIHPVFPERDLSSLKELTQEEQKELTKQFMKENELRNILGNTRYKTSNGTFAFTSLPLGYTYKISARSGYTLLASEPITLTIENPIQKIPLKQAPLEKIRGRVLMLDGSPCIDMPVRLSVRIMHHSHGNEAVPTDQEGYFEFSDLNPDPSVMYDLMIETGDEWQPIRTTLAPGSYKEFTLRKGLILKGRVIDHQTGQPLVDLSVATANLAQLHAGMNDTYAQTDSEGRFVFSTLALGEYALGVHNMELVFPVSSNGYFTTFTAGEIDFIELKVKPMTNLPHFMP